MEDAEWKLQQINRQAKDSPIIRLAYMARNGEYIKHGTYGNGIIKVHADDEEVSAALLSKMDQVICGTNDTRGILNRNIRRHLGHNVRLLPAKGESLIGTTNVVGQQVFNGQQWVCDSDDLGGVPLKFGSRKKMRITIPGTDEFRFISFAFPEDELFDKFGDNESAAFRMMKDEEIYGIDFGYAITCHKCIVGGTVTPTSQGLLTLDEFHQENGLSTKVGEFEPLPTTVTTSNGLTSKDTIDSFFNNGVDDVLKITTTRLYELKATRNHNIPVIRNGSVIMVHAENIIESDRVLLNTSTNAFNDEIIVNNFGKLDRNLAILLGLFISCGSINGNEIIFHGVSDEDRDMVCNRIWRTFGKSRSICIDEDGGIVTRIPKEKVKIWKELTNTDSIHIDIRKSPERVQKMFIKGLTMSSKIIYKVSKLPTRRVFKFRSLSFKFKDNVSHNFMEMLRYMMLNFGVVTSMYKHSPKELRIFGYWARTFFERISLVQYKHYSFFEKLVRSDKANLDDKPNIAIRIGDLTKQIFEEAIEIDPKFKRLFSKIIDIDKIDMNIHSEILHKVVNVLRNDRNAYAIIRKSINYRFFEKIVLGDLVIDIVTDVEDDGKHPTFCLRMSNSTLPMFTQNGILGGNSQGSSWGKVAVFDESYIFGRGKGNKDNAKKWLYTAITRAENKLLILGN
ncbi:hypothetical protein [Proteus mirabilis]|uniref:hypothetical protein n=1 Tax=Proteus mirabilis TaxID=584 RepID=UPI0034D74A0E